MDLDEEKLKATKKLNTKKIEKNSSIKEKQEKSSCIEKSADEMFEELGYEKVEDIRESIGFVYFKREKHFIYNEYPKIIFHNKIEKLTIQNDYLTMQELEAINKKCKELGWLDD
jgi:hypothetical protein